MKINVATSFRLVRPEEVVNSVCIIIDIFRATSTMCTAFSRGCKEIKPVVSIEDCLQEKSKGYLLVGERNGYDIEGFDFNNSPTLMLNTVLDGKKICMTTMNGTLALNAVAHCKKTIIGSFLNISSIVNYLHKEKFESVFCICGGNTGGWNLCGADTMFAGAIVNRLRDSGYRPAKDNALITECFYREHAGNLKEFIPHSDFFREFKDSELHIKDAGFCLQEDYFEGIPVLGNDGLLKLD